MSDIPRAELRESDGEISCSVEETNRLRAALGLRPLDMGPSKSSKPEVDVRVNAAQAREQEQVRQRIEQSRREREAAQASRGQGLGDALKAKSLSAADWVVQSRQKEVVDKAKQQRSRIAALGADDEEEDGSAGRALRPSADPAGLRIHHESHEFTEGSSAVLTLADRSLLTREGSALAEEEDELVNDSLLDRERASEASARRQEMRQPTGYSGLRAAEEDAADALAAGGAGELDAEGRFVAPKKSLLSQYDGGLDGRGRGGSGRLVIGQGGSVVDTASADAVRARLAAAAAAKGRVLDSLGQGGADGSGGEAAGPRVASDYYSPAEMAAMRRPGPKGKKAGLRKKSAAAAEEEGGAVAAAPPSAPPADSLAQPNPLLLTATAGGGEEGERDRGSRAQRRGAPAPSSSSSSAAASQLVSGGDAAREEEHRRTGEVAYAAALARAAEHSAAALGPAPSTLGPGAPAGGAAPAAGPGPSARHAPAPPSSSSSAPAGMGGAVAAAAAAAVAAGQAATASGSGHRVYSRLRAAEGGGHDGGEEDDDAELTAMLARARRVSRAGQQAAPATGLALAAARLQPAAGSSAAAAMDVDAAAVKEEGGPATAGQGGNRSGGGGGGGMVFTDTTEFSRLLQGRMLDREEEHRSMLPGVLVVGGDGAVVGGGPGAGGGAQDGSGSRKRARFSGAGAGEAAGEGAGGDAWMPVRSSGPKGGRGGLSDESADGTAGQRKDGGDAGLGGAGGEAPSDDDDGSEGEGGDSGEEEEEEAAGRAAADLAAQSFTGSEQKVVRGVAGALSLLARSGSLQYKHVYKGRTKDERIVLGPSGAGAAAVGASSAPQVFPARPDGSDLGHEVVLEYKDKQGNLLTTKEAYRELCYQFHGRAPSQNTRDKRMRKMKKEQQLAHASSTDTPLGSLTALRRTQEARGEAHLLLSRK